nr:EOG090X05Q1 [Eulimnadia texana]
MAGNGSLLRFTSRLSNLQLYRNNKLFYIGLRTFLSEAYQCTESWNRRLQSPVMQKIRVEEFYYDILKKFQSSGKASAIDVDMFVNAPVDSHIDELIHVTNRFRRSPSTVNALPSTSHAVIRNLLEQNETDTLMRLINDRLNYGLFPDYYLSNLMMDKFLKQSNYRDAVKVAIQMMLQEDFDHPIASHMALYSCYSYLRNPVPEPWDPQPQPKPEEPAEVVKVRVDYLREPFFDDHFDLTDPKHLVGKTLIVLFQKYDKVSLKNFRIVGNCQLQKKEETLFFFENQTQWELLHEEKEKLREELTVVGSGLPEYLVGEGDEARGVTEGHGDEKLVASLSSASLSILNCLLETLLEILTGNEVKRMTSYESFSSRLSRYQRAAIEKLRFLLMILQLADSLTDHYKLSFCFTSEESHNLEKLSSQVKEPPFLAQAEIFPPKKTRKNTSFLCDED